MVLSSPLCEGEVADTLDAVLVETSVKQIVPVERMASPVSVVNMKDLEDRGIDSPKKLSAVVPNLYIPDYGSSMTSSIYLRGFGSRMENPVLGLYVDDVPVLNKNAYDMDMLDIRRADLIRGPQGTLYGRNSMCGVLSLSTLSPSVYNGVRASVEYGSANTVAAKVSAYGKTEGGLAVGGVVGYRHSDGFYTNEYDGGRCDRYDGLSMRLRMEKRLRPDLYFENIFSAGALRQGGWPYRQYVDGVLLPISYNDECAYSRLNITEAVKLRYEREDYSLSSVSALQALFDRMDLDQDFTTISMFTLAQIQREAALTQEIVLNPKQGWKTDWWNWQGGVFAFYKGNRMSAPVNFKRDGINELILGNANANIPEDIAGGFDDPLAVYEDEFVIGFAILPLDEADHLGCLDGRGDVDAELARLTGGKGSEGVLVGKQFAVVKNPHKCLLKCLLKNARRLNHYSTMMETLQVRPERFPGSAGGCGDSEISTNPAGMFWHCFIHF